MFANVRQHFILSSARDPKRRPKRSLFDWLPCIRTYVYLSGPICNHMCIGARVHPHRVKGLLSVLNVPIRRRRREIASERANIDGSRKNVKSHLTRYSVSYIRRPIKKDRERKSSHGSKNSHWNYVTSSFLNKSHYTLLN